MATPGKTLLFIFVGWFFSERSCGSRSEWDPIWKAKGGAGWEQKGLKLIDFGRSIDLNLYPKGTVFSGDSSADSFRCPEMITGRPWTYQVFSFSLFFSFLFG